MVKEEPLLFRMEEPPKLLNSTPWKVLVVDDEPDVYHITKLCYRNLAYKDRPINTLYASCKKDALDILGQDKDIALILLDVVMEEDDTGLKIARAIREDLNNYLVRIILRTGQPGNAPPLDVVTNYEIDDYRLKSDLTAEKLSTLLISSLRSFEKSVELEKTQGLLRKNLDTAIDQYKAIVEAMPILVVRFNTSFEITYINSNYSVVLGESPNRLIGINLLTLLSPRESAECLKRLRQLSASHPIHTYEIRSDHSSHKRWYRWTNVALMDTEGEIIEYQALGEDITESKNTEIKLHHMERMGALGEFAGGIAHNFNNQLAIIMGYCEYLLINKDGDMGPKIQLIRNAAERASDLTKKMLTFARQDEAELSPIEINDIVLEMDRVLPQIFPKDLSVCVRVGKEKLIINGCQSLIQNAIFNICINARDAMGGEGSLLIALDSLQLDEYYCSTVSPNLTPGLYARVSVEDNGPGIPKEIVSKIFDPFFTTKPPGKGTGMGLSTVYGTMKQHKGAVHVYSEGGQGTVFHLYFPLLNQGDEIAKELPLKKADFPYNILIVEDDEEISKLLQSTLNLLGYKATAVKDGQEALDRLKVSLPDLVILDIMMPHKNGCEVYEEILKEHKGVKIIVYSGSKRFENQFRGIPIVQKPFSMSELSHLIADTLR